MIDVSGQVMLILGGRFIGAFSRLVCARRLAIPAGFSRRIM